MDAKKFKRLCVILCICLIPLVLTACGKELTQEEQMAKAAAKSAKAMRNGFIGLFLNAFACIPIVLGTLKSNNTAQRGTNTVTRFVRKSATHGKQTMYFAMLTLLLMSDMICIPLFSGFHITKLLAFLPPIGCVAYIIISMNKSAKDKERIKDARVVTKAGLQVGAGAAKGVAVAGTMVAATAAAPVTGGASLAAGAAATVAVAKASSSIMDTAQKNMTDVQLANDIDQDAIADATAGLMQAKMQAASKHIEAVADTELFKQKAMRLGCNENMSLGEMAQIVLKYAPAASMKELPEGLSDEDKAVMLLGAMKQQPKAIEQRTPKPEVVDAEYREVKSSNDDFLLEQRRKTQEEIRQKEEAFNQTLREAEAAQVAQPSRENTLLRLQAEAKEEHRKRDEGSRQLGLESQPLTTERQAQIEAYNMQAAARSAQLGAEIEKGKAVVDSV